MMGVKAVAAATPAAGPRRPAADGGFAVSGGAGPLPAAAAMPAGPVGGMLLLQEMDAGPARDRGARKHGRAMLDALAALQRALLDGGEDPAALDRLAALLQHCPEASDPGLRATVAAVALRVHVELARRGR